MRGHTFVGHLWMRSRQAVVHISLVIRQTGLVPKPKPECMPQVRTPETTLARSRVVGSFARSALGNALATSNRASSRVVGNRETIPLLRQKKEQGTCRLLAESELLRDRTCCTLNQIRNFIGM
jgi:hypothetical protein